MSSGTRITILVRRTGQATRLEVTTTLLSQLTRRLNEALGTRQDDGIRDSRVRTRLCGGCAMTQLERAEHLQRAVENLERLMWERDRINQDIAQVTIIIDRLQDKKSNLDEENFRKNFSVGRYINKS